MEKISDNTKTLARTYRQFYQGLVDINLNKQDWDSFFHNKKEVNGILGIEDTRFQIDHSGSRWIESLETSVQDKQWDGLFKEINFELSSLVVLWVQQHRERGWRDFISFLTSRKDDFIEEISDYIYLHQSSYDEDGETENDMEEIITQFESTPVSYIREEGEDEDSIDLDSILRYIQDEDEPTDDVENTTTEEIKEPTIDQIYDGLSEVLYHQFHGEKK